MSAVLRKISAALLLLCLMGCSNDTPQQKTHKVGIMYNLTGDQAPIDSASLKGVELAHKLRKEKGMNDLELVIKNGNTNVKLIAAQAKELAALPEIVSLIGYSDNDMVLAAAPEAAKQKKIFLTSGATSPLLPQQIPEYLFLVAFGDNDQAAAAAQYAYEKLGLKNVFILVESGMDYAQLLTRYFKESFTHLGGSVIGEEPLEGLGKIPPKADFLFLACSPAKAPVLLKQIRAAGFQKPVFGGDSFAAFNPENGAAAGKVYFTSHVFFNPSSKNPRVAEFIKAYTAAYQTPPPNAFAALGFDAFNLMADAIARAKSYDTADILRALENTRDFEGVTGKISYDKGSHVPKKPVTLLILEKGIRREVANFIPKYIPKP